MNAASWLGPTLGLMSGAPHSHGPFSVFRKTAQGAGAGLLGVSGAGAIQSDEAAAAVAPKMDWTSFDGLASGLATGAFNGQLQLAAAVLIFLAAGRCIARMAGLGLVIGGFLAYSQGMRWDDLTPLLQSFWLRLNAAVAAFMSPPATTPA